MKTNVEQITVIKDFRTVVCGTISTFRDHAGNERFHANRTVDKDKFTFWSKSAAIHWMHLGGWLHG